MFYFKKTFMRINLKAIGREFLIEIALFFLCGMTMHAGDIYHNFNSKNPTPTALPVLSADEAEKTNDFHCFLSTVNSSTVEGIITDRSELPDPSLSDYPDCRFTVHFTGNSIISGESCPKEMILIIEGFANYKILDSNKIQKGDKVRCEILPFDHLPEFNQSTQQADDLDLFLLDRYYCLDIQAISTFEDSEFIPKSGIFFLGSQEDYISIFERNINPAITKEIKKAQDDSITTDLLLVKSFFTQYSEEDIERINLEFDEAWIKEQLKDPQGYNRVDDGQRNIYVWRNINNSFYTLPLEYKFIKQNEPIPQDVLDSFISLKKACEHNGVQLIISIVPDLFAISSRVINKEFRDIPDFQTATWVKQLSECGIETPYYADAIIENFNRHPFCFFYPSNTHPADTAQDVITDVLKARLCRYNIEEQLDSNAFTYTATKHHPLENHKENAFPQDCDIGDNQPGDPLYFKEVLYHGKPLKNPSQSSILVIGNSFIQWPCQYPDSMPTLLSAKILSPVKWYRIGWLGPFTDIMLQILSRPEDFLKGKKILIMQFGVDSLNRVIHGYSMVNLSQIDSQRLLLNKTTLKRRIYLSSDDDISSTSRYNSFFQWKNSLPGDKSCFLLKQKKDLIQRISFIDSESSNLDDSRPFILIIPAVSYYEQSCKLEVNNISQVVPAYNYAENARYFNLVYKLPAGTKGITINVEGKPGNLLAIKEIQIRQ